MAQILGTDLDEILIGTDANDLIEGRGGSDVLRGLKGNDTLDGGEGIDTASYEDSAGAVQAALGLNGADGGARKLGPLIGLDTLRSIENLRGSRFDDRLSGNESDNVIEGGAGNDVIDGGAGFDTASYRSSSGPVHVVLGLNGVDGQAQESSEPFGPVISTDTIRGIENVIGSSFNDTLIGNEGDNVFEGGSGGDTIDGGGGIDTASYEGNTNAVAVTLGLNGAEGTVNEVFPVFSPETPRDRLFSIENVRGSAFNDLLTGNEGTNVLEGLGGDDILVGRSGADTLDGGDGIDTVSYAASATAVKVSLATGIAGGGDASGDTLIKIENVVGSDFGDKLVGSALDNRLEGGKGADVLDGAEGADTLIGGAGIDKMRGGAAADTFMFLSVKDGLGSVQGDQIFDFESGLDRIDISAIDAIMGQGSNDTFTFVESYPGIAPHAGQVVVNNQAFDKDGDGIDDGILATVSLHVNNDGQADMVLTATTSLAQGGLAATDFIL